MSIYNHLINQKEIITVDKIISLFNSDEKIKLTTIDGYDISKWKSKTRAAQIDKINKTISNGKLKAKEIAKLDRSFMINLDFIHGENETGKCWLIWDRMNKFYFSYPKCKMKELTKAGYNTFEDIQKATYKEKQKNYTIYVTPDDSTHFYNISDDKHIGKFNNFLVINIFESIHMVLVKILQRLKTIARSKNTKRIKAEEIQKQYKELQKAIEANKKYFVALKQEQKIEQKTLNQEFRIQQNKKQWNSKPVNIEIDPSPPKIEFEKLELNYSEEELEEILWD